MRNNSQNALVNPNLIGWFAVALSKEMKLGSKKTGFLAGEFYTLIRVANGQLLFNGNSEGIREQNDFIFVWHHPKKLEPLWDIPALDESVWSHFLHHQLTARTHPQEVYENCIDVTHFAIVHGFSDITSAHEPLFEKHCMSVKHYIRRKSPNPFTKKLITANFEVRLHGIGCAHTHIEVPAFGMVVRMFTLATPTQIGWVEIRIAVAIAMNKLPVLKKFFIPFIHQSIQKNIIHDFCQDLSIWENKCYRKQPLLVKGDGQIMKFRRWCHQFYA